VCEKEAISPERATQNGISSKTPQSLSKILLHIVFSTKNREQLIADDIKPSLHAYIAGACRGLGCNAYAVGGTNDHVHIACALTRTLPVSRLLEDIKKSSSAWIKNQNGCSKLFSWQAGYGAFSLGQSQLPSLLKYIRSQDEHHRGHSYKDELRLLLDRYGIEYDERYLWD